MSQRLRQGRRAKVSRPKAAPFRPGEPGVPEYEGFAHWDSQCFFPPLELAGLVAGGALPEGVAVLDAGCGHGVEALFLSRMGWRRVYAVDQDEEMLRSAASLCRRYRGQVSFAKMDLGEGRMGLPAAWPRRYGLVLDRLLINNFSHGEAGSSRRLYFQRMAELVAPGGVLVVRDRLPECDEATLRRRLFSAVREEDFFAGSGAERFFRPRRGSRLLNVRLVGDDTDDDRRLDAMIAVPGVLAVLERRR